MANALMSQFPAADKLEFVHMPLAHGVIPPTTDDAFYQPLDKLKLPAGVRFVAGFVHERQNIEDQVKVQGIIESHVDRGVLEGGGGTGPLKPRQPAPDAQGANA